MLKKPKKVTRPSSFIHDSQNWRINYFSEKLGENLGETHLNINEIRIWTKDVPDDCIRETLQHELLHVVMRDCLVILHDSTSLPQDLEESIIRMCSPRLFALLSQNPKLRSYIYGA